MSRPARMISSVEPSGSGSSALFADRPLRQYQKRIARRTIAAMPPTAAPAILVVSLVSAGEAEEDPLAAASVGKRDSRVSETDSVSVVKGWP